MIAPFDSEDALSSTSNGSHTAPAAPEPSIEGLLFAAGAISPDQLGELVRDAVLTKRPVAAVAVERGFVTREALADLLAASGANVSVPEALGEVAVAPASPAPAVALDPEVTRAVIAAVQPIASALPAPDPALQPDPPAAFAPVEPTVAVPDSAVVVPEPAVVEPEPVAAAPEPVAVDPDPVVAVSVEDRVRAVALAAELPVQASPPVNGHPAPSVSALFAVSVRLESGERIAVDTADSIDRATEIARAVVETAKSGEWPFVSGRFIRPAAVVSIDIERALEA